MSYLDGSTAHRFGKCSTEGSMAHEPGHGWANLGRGSANLG